MKRRRFLAVSALATMLAACGAPSQSPAATSAPVLSQATIAPVAAPVQGVAAAKPVFIDFYAPW